MRVLVISHQRDAGAGVFGDAILADGAGLDIWHRAETGSPRRPVADYDAVMTFGGAMHPDQEEEHPWLGPEKALLAELMERGKPLLGACLGSQILAEAAGGSARLAREPEIGWHDVELTPEAAADPVFGALPARFEAFQWHSYESTLPPGAVALARSPASLQGYRIGERAWGMQFHAEVSSEDAEKWIREYRTDPDAVRIGVDPQALLEQTRERIAAWNEMGRAFCERFLAVARGLTPA